MAEVIDFAAMTDRRSNKPDAALHHDPYFRFIRSVLQTADACGFLMPFTIESAAEHVYYKTRHTSEVAKLLRHKP
jgi:hypothetical protein